jgi:hypothetical protein
MSLREQLRRGTKTSISNTRRKRPIFFKPLPMKTIDEHQVYEGVERDPTVQLRRGGIIPNAGPRTIDHDIAGILAVQTHGVKVQLGDSSVAALRKPDLLSKINDAISVILGAKKSELDALVNVIGLPIGSQNSTIVDWFRQVEKGNIIPPDGVLTNALHALNNIKFMDKHRRTHSVLNVIQDANDDQLKALANLVGVPIVTSINEMRDNINNAFSDMFASGFNPSLDKQDEIIELLGEIEGNAGTASGVSPATQTPPTAAIELPRTITPHKFQAWKDDGSTLAIKLKQLEQNAIASGLQVLNDKKPFSKHKFIYGINGDPITVDYVKKSMKTGNFVLNTKDFKLEKV